MNAVPLYNLGPLAQLLLGGLALAVGPVAWVGLRHRGLPAPARLRALAALALFLSFDLVLVGAFTRLTDSGLGCPDWPGCYGHASPVGASAPIQAAQAAMPTGPVTQRKAWIEMAHRYLATAVGVLIVVLTLASWLEYRRRPRGAVDARPALSPWWPTATLLWVCLQGAFGALTVTMKLYPAIVTAHLLGGIGLLALLAAQTQDRARAVLELPRALYAGVGAVGVLAALQIALGGWVSTNYAVLACTEFPTCQGTWWPPSDFRDGFTLLRGLGADGRGGMLAFPALTAIHLAHRLGAVVVFAAIAWLAGRLWADGRAAHRRWAWALMAAAAWQGCSGVANVVLGWPLAAAMAHTAGAAVLVMLLTAMWARSRGTAASPYPAERGSSNSAAAPRWLRRVS